MLYVQFKELWSDLDSMLRKYRDEVTELRDAAGPVHHSESMIQLKDRLTTNRQSLDRIEAIIADVGLVRAKCKQMVAELEESYEQRWAEVMGQTRVGEYTSAKERDATYATGAIQERVNLRRGEKILADISSVHEFCLTKFRGLSTAQRDTETRLKLFNVERLT